MESEHEVSFRDPGIASDYKYSWGCEPKLCIHLGVHLDRFMP